MKAGQMNKKAQGIISVLVILVIVIVGSLYIINSINKVDQMIEQSLKEGDCVIDYSSPLESSYQSGIVTEIYQDYQGQGLAYKVVHNNDPKDFTISSAQTFKLTNKENCQ